MRELGVKYREWQDDGHKHVHEIMLWLVVRREKMKPRERGWMSK
jgi:hypothetical protein